MDWKLADKMNCITFKWFCWGRFFLYPSWTFDSCKYHNFKSHINNFNLYSRWRPAIFPYLGGFHSVITYELQSLICLHSISDINHANLCQREDYCLTAFASMYQLLTPTWNCWEATVCVSAGKEQSMDSVYSPVSAVRGHLQMLIDWHLAVTACMFYLQYM